MAADLLHLHLQASLLDSARAGGFNLANRIAAAIAPLDVTLDLRPDTPEDRAMAAGRPGWTLFHMQEPIGPRCLCLRRTYHYPFWRIEATHERWHFDVARARFDPAAIDPGLARPFAARWRERIHGKVAPTREGFVLVPLQGRLLDHRSFQSMSPLAMVETLLDRDPRPVRATLHPRETYLPDERRALERIEARHPRFRVVPGDPGLLSACDHVVTQNSSVALNGFFLGKRAVLFAGADFHHVAGSVPRDGIDRAFAVLDGPGPDFAAYLYWFFRLNCINGGAAEAEGQIRASLRRHGWPH